MKTVEERFHAAYKKLANDCWEWIKSKDTHGYGQLWKAGAGFRMAHKWSWVIHNGDVPEGMCVCHSCDNPACVNPNHLFLGTVAANMADMRGKGRQAKGMPPREMTRRVKLTEDQARAIKRDKRPPTVIATEYGVSKGAVVKIRYGERWWWI